MGDRPTEAISRDEHLARLDVLRFPLIALVAIGQHVPTVAPFFNGQNLPLTAMRPFQMIDAIIGITRYPTAYQFWFIRDLMILVILSPLLWLAARYVGWVVLAMFAIGWIFNIWPVSVPAIEPTLFFYLGGFVSIRGWSLFAFDRLGWWLVPLFALLLGVYCAEKLIYRTDYSLHPPMVVGLILALKASRWLAESNRWRERLMALGGASFFVFAAHEPLVTIGKKLAFHSLPMTAGTVLATYAVLPVVVICLALAGYWILLKTMPGLLRFITGGR